MFGDSFYAYSGTSLRDLALMPDAERQQLPDLPAPEHVRLGAAGDKPIFFGHYWMRGEPRLQWDNAVCVDYGAGNGGPPPDLSERIVDAWPTTAPPESR